MITSKGIILLSSLLIVSMVVTVAQECCSKRSGRGLLVNNKEATLNTLELTLRGKFSSPYGLPTRL